MSTAQLIGDRGGLPAETTSVALSRPEAARRLPLMFQRVVALDPRGQAAQASRARK